MKNMNVDLVDGVYWFDGLEPEALGHIACVPVCRYQFVIAGVPGQLIERLIYLN